MNYIQKLKGERDTLFKFFNEFCDFDKAKTSFESAPYKGDAMREIEKAYGKLKVTRKDIETNIVASIKKEELHA